MNFRPNSLDRFRARLAMREGMDLAPGCVTVTCQLFDSAIGGKGPSSTETTQTTSGNARGVAGNKNQYTESGSISVGQKGKYIESGALDLAGQKISVAKGASLTLNQAPAAGTSATGLNNAPQPISNPTSGGSTTVVPTPASPSSPTPDSSTSTSSGIWDTIKTYWTNFSTGQKIGGGVVLVLVLWLIFHKRSK